MSDQSSPAEKYLRMILADRKLPFDEALKRTRDDLAALPGIDVMVAGLKTAHDAQVHQATKLREMTTSQARDDRERGWYFGVPREDGVWGGLRERMTSSGLADAVEGIDESSDSIVGSLAQPGTRDDRRLGLVVGNVQSGKTANFSAVAAKALDCGYKFVLVLSGIHNNLRRQTQQRLERDLGVRSDPTRWYTLTDVDRDFGAVDKMNATAIVSNNDRILAVVKKNSRRLENVLTFLRSLDTPTRERTPFLIIDDESDQATPDSSAKIEDEPTTINRLLKEIWAEMRNSTYVGYTATPFANVFMDPDSGSSPGSIEDLYPKDFIHVMPTPSTYFGAEAIFGLSATPGENQDPVTPDVVRTIPESEVEVLAPRGRDARSTTPHVTKALAEALRWFVVACAVRRVRGQHEEHSTMLIHTTHRVDPHFAMREIVEDFLEPLKRRAREGDVEDFREVFHAEIDRAARLYTGAAAAPTWPKIADEIPNVLRVVDVAVDNGRADEEERLSYDNGTRTVIVIGGGTLSRGLTLNGLFVSFFTRTSNTYDTLLQMGRWFGYRDGYEDLQRIWLAPGLEEDYRFLATVESDLREDITRMIRSKQTPGEIGVRVREHPGRLQITNPAKMKHVRRVAADFEGYRLQTTLFDVRSEATLTSNAAAVERLVDALDHRRSARSTRLFESVEVAELAGFFEEFEAHPHFSALLTDAYEWARDKMPWKTWNVVIAQGDAGDAERMSGPFASSAVRRAPVDDPRSAAEGTVNIRALMSGQDIVADLALNGALATAGGRKGSLSNQEQVDARRSARGADGRGLLVIYPVSRFSEPKSGGDRQYMRDTLAAVDPALVEPGHPPLMGVALVGPIDREGRVASKGRFVAVEPAFGEPEDIDEPGFHDVEGDYAGAPE